MKKLLFGFSILVFTAISSYGSGVAIIDAENQVYLKLLQSEIEVTVENQVAVIKSTQLFKNEDASSRNVKFAFPLPEGASAVDLFWRANGNWYQANIAATPPDTSFPGGEPHANLVSYLGSTPLYFTIDQAIDPDSTLIVELYYVELLKYENGDVNFFYPNDYRLIQNSTIIKQYFNFQLNSSRTINNIELTSHTATNIINNGNSAQVEFLLWEAIANIDYELNYTLDLNQLGLFSFSTQIADSLLPDTHGGFYVFVAEPDPSSTTDIIQKYFSLIIDRSGSMSGTKIQQAKDAAQFIVENLNPGDKFNIIDFASSVSSFRPGHTLFTPDARDSAISYISGLYASGGTNISGAFDVAIPQFSASNDSAANIIIFFTDGQPTAGITSTQGILDAIAANVSSAEVNLAIFTFGIGSSLNQQLLTLIASQNNGLSEFLGDNDLYSVITNFYLKIRNPVLINTQISFTPDVVHETYPSPLPNLYKGQQMIVSGRYTQSQNVTVNLSGTALGQPVNYQYNIDLVDTTSIQYNFLPKIWAKSKIEHLLIQYYSLDPNTPLAETIKQQIIDISIGYGVISPFTNFTGGDPLGIDEEESKEIPQIFTLHGNYPNPFNSSTIIQFSSPKILEQPVAIKIYNTLGQLVKILYVNVNRPGMFEVFWDGTNILGNAVPTGSYFYLIDFGEGILAGKMMLIR